MRWLPAAAVRTKASWSCSVSFTSNFCYLWMKHKDEVRSLAPSCLVLLCVCCFFPPLSSRRVRELATPKAWVMYTYQQQTAIVPSCPRDVDCKVQIWLWIYFFPPQIRAFQMQSLVWLDTYIREVGPGTPQRPPALPRGESHPSQCSVQETKGRERRHAWPNPPHFALGGCTCANRSVLTVCCTTSAPKSVFLWLFAGMLGTDSWCNRARIGNR